MVGSRFNETMEEDTINAINVSWYLICSFFIFFMNAGFIMIEVGRKFVHLKRLKQSQRRGPEWP